jgi:hypothetical protein
VTTQYSLTSERSALLEELEQVGQVERWEKSIVVYLHHSREREMKDVVTHKTILQLYPDGNVVTWRTVMSALEANKGRLPPMPHKYRVADERVDDLLRKRLIAVSSKQKGQDNALHVRSGRNAHQ